MTNQLWISLTTIPSRLNNIHPTLDSLKKQTHKASRINLCIPLFSKREQTTYNIPENIASDKGITIVRCKDDYGPATKLLGSLEICDDPETSIVTVDDDTIYPNDLIEKLNKHSLDHPDSAIGFCGWNVADILKGRSHFYSHLVYEERNHNIGNVTSVDILEGYRGILYKRKFFNSEIYKLSDSAFYVDDVWISGHLAVNMIKRLSLKYNFGEYLSKDDVYHRIWKSNVKSQNNSLSSMCNFLKYNTDVAIALTHKYPDIWT